MATLVASRQNGMTRKSTGFRLPSLHRALSESVARQERADDSTVSMGSMITEGSAAMPYEPSRYRSNANRKASALVTTLVHVLVMIGLFAGFGPNLGSIRVEKAERLTVINLQPPAPPQRSQASKPMPDAPRLTAPVSNAAPTLHPMLEIARSETSPVAVPVTTAVSAQASPVPTDETAPKAPPARPAPAPDPNACDGRTSIGKKRVPSARRPGSRQSLPRTDDGHPLRRSLRHTPGTDRTDRPWRDRQGLRRRPCG